MWGPAELNAKKCKLLLEGGRRPYIVSDIYRLYVTQSKEFCLLEFDLISVWEGSRATPGETICQPLVVAYLFNQNRNIMYKTRLLYVDKNLELGKQRNEASVRQCNLLCLTEKFHSMAW